jgi:hypothetical protein
VEVDMSQPTAEERAIAEKAIREAFPKDADTIIAELRWFPLEGCFGFSRWGMFVGIERDGYIHT